MPDFINGLPLHALVVHGVVVLVPLAVLGAIVISLWPAARRRYGWLVVAFAAVSLVLVPVATQSGEGLERKLPENPLIETHADLGDTLIFFVGPLFLAVLGLMIVHTVAAKATAAAPSTQATGGTITETRTAPGWTKVALIVAAVLSIGFGVASGVQVFRIGDAGAKAVWDGVEDQPSR